MEKYREQSDALNDQQRLVAEILGFERNKQLKNDLKKSGVSDSLSSLRGLMIRKPIEGTSSHALHQRLVDNFKILDPVKATELLDAVKGKKGEEGNENAEVDDIFVHQLTDRDIQNIGVEIKQMVDKITDKNEISHAVRSIAKSYSNEKNPSKAEEALSKEVVGMVVSKLELNRSSQNIEETLVDITIGSPEQKWLEWIIMHPANEKTFPYVNKLRQHRSSHPLSNKNGAAKDHPSIANVDKETIQNYINGHGNHLIETIKTYYENTFDCAKEEDVREEQKKLAKMQAEFASLTTAVDHLSEMLKKLMNHFLLTIGPEHFHG